MSRSRPRLARRIDRLLATGGPFGRRSWCSPSSRPRSRPAGRRRRAAAVSVRNASETTTNRFSSLEDPADPAQPPGSDHRRVGRDDPEEPDRAHLGELEHLHRVGRRRPGRELRRARRSRPAPSSATWSGFFQLRKAMNSPLTPHSRVFWAVGWPFIWKTVEPGLPIRPADQVQVVDLDGAGGRLERLVDALQAGRHETRRRPEDLAPPPRARRAARR